MAATITPKFLSFVIPEKDGVSHTLAYTLWDSDEPVPTPRKNVICVHGLTRNSRDFDRIATRLASTNKYRVYGLDVVGRGRSSKLDPKSSLQYGYALYVSDAFAFLQHLNLETVDFWIGTSMGGIIAILMCSTHPHVITNLVLNDVGIFVPKEGIDRLLTYVGTDPKFNSKQEAKEYLQEIFKTFGELSDEIWQEMTDSSVYLDVDLKQYRLNYDPNIKNALNPGDVDLEPFFIKVNSRILLLRGSLSDILPADTAEKMRTLSGKLTLVTFPNIGHAPSLMVHDQINTVLSWMDQCV